ncbi:hypothetical protein BLOT_005512, partial [Blomia tropicalis]
ALVYSRMLSLLRNDNIDLSLTLYFSRIMNDEYNKAIVNIQIILNSIIYSKNVFLILKCVIDLGFWPRLIYTNIAC